MGRACGAGSGHPARPGPGRQRGGRRWRRLVVGVAVVGVLTGCGGDDAGVDDGEVIETMLPTAPPATDPLDPSE